MEASILKSVKKILGLEADYTAFDHDIITHINSVIENLTQLGVGPADGFFIEDASATWEQYLGATETRYNSVKTYLFLKVRMYFDPPQTGYHIQAIQEQLRELEWRLYVNREQTDWTDPDPEPVVPTEEPTF